MGISSGLLNHALTLQTLTETTDGQGGYTTAWADTGTFMGRMSALSPDEKMAQDKLTTFATHKIFCDNMSVTTADRIKWGDYYFQITGINNPSEMYHHLEIFVTEID